MSDFKSVLYNYARNGLYIHLAVGIEAVRHMLVLVELPSRLGLFAPAALFGSGSPLL